MATKSKTRTAVRSAKLPSKGRYLGDGTPVSSDELKRKYVIRSFTFPIASPEDMGKGSQKAWANLRSVLDLAFSRSTEAANWGVQRLFAAEQLKVPGLRGQRMPHQKVALYGLRHNSFWAGWSKSASAVLRGIEKKWAEVRFRTAWTCEQAVPHLQYPYPYPISAQDWSVYEKECGGLFFRANLGNGQMAVRLTCGPEFRYQLVRARWLIKNPRMRCESAVLEKKKVVGGKQVRTIFVKIVGYVPREEQHEAKGMMIVHTTPESFLVGYNTNEDRLWVINGDRCKDWITRHDRYMQRWREDQKYEIRRPKRSNRSFVHDMELRCQKKNDRVDSFLKETAAQVVNHAVRRRLAEVVFSDENRQFFGDGFPWFRFKELLQQKCEQKGVGFRYVEKPSEST
ncbi:MAG: hypothetical protein E6Q97_35610 [Desulfurellales bacterium]|nr:MAG: hypothetical protein E6Q97_35610 [Desulfurellales bacterium]